MTKRTPDSLCRINPKRVVSVVANSIAVSDISTLLLVKVDVLVDGKLVTVTLLLGPLPPSM